MLFRSENHWQNVQFAALGIATRETDLLQELSALAPLAPPAAIPEGLTELIVHYQQNRDIVGLRAVARRWPQLRCERLIDLNSRQAFLLLAEADGRTPLLVANLAPRDYGRSFRWPAEGEFRATVEAFIDTRAGRLEFGRRP